MAYAFRRWLRNNLEPAFFPRLLHRVRLRLCSNNRDDKGEADDPAHNRERKSRGNMHPWVGEHFSPNKHDGNRQAFIEVLKILQDSGEEKIEGAQTKYRANVGTVNDKGVARHSEHG